MLFLSAFGRVTTVLPLGGPSRWITITRDDGFCTSTAVPDAVLPALSLLGSAGAKSPDFVMPFAGHPYFLSFYQL